MPLRACTVTIHDLNDVAHSLDVTAATLYEAVAAALSALRGHEWVGEIGKGLTEVTVRVRPPEDTLCESEECTGREEGYRSW